MLFVFIGFIILLVSFIIALASLIREQSERADFEAFEGDLSLTAEEVFQESGNGSAKDEESADLASKQAGGTLVNEPNLAEYAPFPWEDTSFELEPDKGIESAAGNGGLSGGLPVSGENHDNLTGEISLSDLKKNFR